MTYIISLLDTLNPPAYKYVVKQDANIIAFFTILHEPYDDDELWLENLCVGTLKNFHKIFKLMIDYLNENFNIKNYVINVNYVYFKYINKNYFFENVSDFENYDNYTYIKLDEKELDDIKKNVDTRIEEYGVECDNGCLHYNNCNNSDECLDNEINCNCYERYLYNDINFVLFKDIVKFMHDTCTLYIKNEQKSSFIFSKKCIHKKQFDNSDDEIELSISNEKGYSNILFPKIVNNPQIISFIRKFYPIKFKVKGDDYISNINGIVFSEAITFVTDKEINDIKFTLKINNKYYTKDTFSFDYRLNKLNTYNNNGFYEQYTIHGKELYLKCYNIKGLVMFATDNDYVNYIYDKKYRIKNKEEVANCKYSYPQLIDLFNNIHKDYPNKIQTKVPEFKYLPIIVPEIPTITDTKISDDEYSYIYIIQEREFINAKQPVYKIGKTSGEIQRRYSQYPKNSRLLFTQHVNNCHAVEKIVIKELTEKFTIRKDIGREYFEGPLNEISKCVSKICNNNI